MTESPIGWSRVKLGDLAVSAVDGPFGSHLKTEHYVAVGGIRVVRLQNIDRGRFDNSDVAFVSREHATGLRRHEVLPGDLLVAALGDANHPVARACLYPESEAPGIVKADCFRFRLQPTLADHAFIMHVLNCPSTRREIDSLGQGVTRDRVNLGMLRRVTVELPPLDEQKQITEILAACDAAIERTEALIGKLQLARAGLLNDLLTRGVGEDGRLRDPVAHAEEFTNSPVGCIPASWRVASLNDLAILITSGSRGWAAYYSDDGPLFIRIGNLTREHVNLRLRDLIHVRPPRGSEGARTRLMPGDLLISITADLGIIGVVPIDLGEAYVNQHIALVRLNWSQVIPHWAGYFLAGRQGQDQFARRNDSGAKAGLNLPSIGATILPLPSLSEQHRITATVAAHDRRIRMEEAYRDKVRLVKQGLMDDLLTGRVRARDVAASVP